MSPRELFVGKGGSVGGVWGPPASLRGRAIFAAVVAALCLGAPHAAHAAWYGPDELSTAAHTLMPGDVAANGTGRGLAVAQRQDGTIDGRQRTFSDWDPLVSTLGTGSDVFNDNNPQLAMNDDGDALAAWSTSAFRIAVAEGSTSGSTTWHPTKLVSTSNQAFHPRVAIDAAGGAAVVWEESGPVTRVATRDSTGLWALP